MVNKRGNYPHSRNSLATKLFPRKLTLYSITVYAILLFAFSIFVFIFYGKDIFQHEQMKPLSSAGSQSQQLPDSKLWGAPHHYGLRPCVKPTAKYKATQGWDRYMTVRSNGGLNQMRTGISDMVAVARIMNATLVIPQLDKRSFWQDSSTFSDVFDELHFTTSLQEDVRIVKELPKELEHVPRARKHFTSWSGMSYYEELTHLWKDYQVVHVVKSDSRLANNDLPVDIQRLRCRALYYALRFSPSIDNLGKKLVEWLRSRGGRYIALHLRYEKDMLSFTGCTHGLTDAESEELRIMRENTNHWKMKKINSTEQRKGGFCPLTPKEETVASQDELKAFSNHASQTAALDYIISVESDVFIPSYSGNMARAVEGHRRFLGHRKTITPDRKGLVEVFDKMEAGQLEEGTSVSYLVMQLHKNRQGAPRKREGPLQGFKGRARFRTEESFYQNPYPECICHSKSTL
ncbi:hypothetical protein ACSBR2_035571 [Camellia fascicularis]